MNRVKSVDLDADLAPDKDGRYPRPLQPKFKIDDGIPLRKIVTRTPVVTYPLDKLKVNQSFYVDNLGSRKTTVSERVRVQARRLKPKKFAIRKEGDGLRVWRVK